MEANTSALSNNIEQLQGKIRVENDKAAKLEKRIGQNVGIGKQEAILQELGDKVTEVGRWRGSMLDHASDLPPDDRAVVVVVVGGD